MKNALKMNPNPPTPAFDPSSSPPAARPRPGAHPAAARAASGVAAAVLLLSGARGLAVDASAPSDGGFFSDWFARASETQAEQPHWVTPLFTVTPRLEEEYRYDQTWQSSAGGHTLTSYGTGKGLELIPCENVEVILGVPAWQHRNLPAAHSGWSDESFLLKYRLAAANEESGNYIVTAFMGLSAPTGDPFNTSDHYGFTPTIAAGKGWGDFDVQSTLGVSFPDNGAAPGGAGTPLLWNTALQYRVVKVLWPQVELNYTYWANGEHEGKNQLFITPGLLLGRFPIWDRLGLTVGLGAQIAVTERPLYNHSIILTARLPF